MCARERKRRQAKVSAVRSTMMMDKMIAFMAVIRVVMNMFSHGERSDVEKAFPKGAATNRFAMRRANPVERQRSNMAD